MKRRSFPLANVLVMFASTILSLLVLELGLRIFWQNPYARTGTSYAVEMRLNRSNLERKVHRAWLDPQDPMIDFRTEGKGYILPSKQFSDPEATIAFLGGSTTECLYVKEPLRFPALVSTYMQEAGRRVSTINAGASGNTTQDAINILLNIVALDSPDIVVLMEAANDAGVLAQDPTYSSRMGQVVSLEMQARWLLQQGSSLSSLVAFVRDRLTYLLTAAYMRVAVREASDVDTPLLSREVEERYIAQLRIFVAVTRALGATPVLMTQPIAAYRNALTPEWARDAQQDRFNQLVRETAAETDAGLIDLAARVSAIPDIQTKPQLYLYDGLHVTDRASQIEARFIADALLPLLALAEPAARQAY